ncbi:Gfo/Idh/MocA family oxidoreductase, partial [Patescibacteria group bacterium]|nr:Gfo/Idh/MocA family oxidoreductase [Patescibacteria group bacterium]
MRILVVGFGSIGRRHVKNLLSLGVDDILLYRRSKKGNEFNIPEYDDLDEALAQKPDAVLIANPTALHIPIAIKAARVGAHLFIEKPLSHNLEGVEELSRIIKEKGLISMIAYQYRFHPALQKIKELIDSGVLGKIIFGRVEVGQYLPDWHPGEDYRKGYSARKDLGGGVILTLIHEIDYLTWLLGKPKSVSSVAGHFSNLEIDIEDLAEISVKYENGALGQIHLDCIQKAP